MKRPSDNATTAEWYLTHKLALRVERPSRHGSPIGPISKCFPSYPWRGVEIRYDGGCVHDTSFPIRGGFGPGLQFWDEAEREMSVAEDVRAGLKVVAILKYEAEAVRASLTIEGVRNGHRE